MRYRLAFLTLLLVLCVPRSPSADDSSGLGPLLSAVLYGDLEKARSLVEAGADPGASGDALDTKPLLYAAWNGDAAMVEMLLEKGAAVDGVDAGWRTPLMLASGTGSLDVVKMLLKAGSSTSKGDRDNATALCHAAGGRNPAVLSHFVKKGKLKNLTQDHIDWCALEYAVVAGRAKNLKLLIKKGADPTTTDMYGRTLLDKARDPEVKKILKKHFKKKGKKTGQQGGILAILGSTSGEQSGAIADVLGAGTGDDLDAAFSDISGVGVSKGPVSPSTKSWLHLRGVQARVQQQRSSLTGCLFKLKKKPKNPWANLALAFNANGKLVQVRVTAGHGLTDDFASCASNVLTGIDFEAPPSGAIVIPASVDL
jgi:hypothetical protein